VRVRLYNTMGEQPGQGREAALPATTVTGKPDPGNIGALVADFEVALPHALSRILRGNTAARSRMKRSQTYLSTRRITPHPIRAPDAPAGWLFRSSGSA
jgi:hypothetical protein